MIKNNLTYEKSGVNIKAADKFVKFISIISKKTKQNSNFNNIGSFGSITKISNKLKNPYIVASSDGVGTKIEIANLLNKFDTIGIDLVAMNVNDIIVQGAKPILFLDYISINKIDLKKLKSIIKGIVKGCKIAGCELVGGETAEMPGTYTHGKFDVAGFSIGLVSKKKIFKKNNIKKIAIWTCMEYKKDIYSIFKKTKIKNLTILNEDNWYYKKNKSIDSFYKLKKLDALVIADFKKQNIIIDQLKNRLHIDNVKIIKLLNDRYIYQNIFELLDGKNILKKVFLPSIII